MSGTHTPRRGYTLFYGYGTVSCFEQKIKEFHSIAYIERGRTVEGPRHKREIYSREYAGDPPPCFDIIHAKCKKVLAV